MEILKILETILAIIIPVTIASIVGWVKINRQIETLETKFEAIQKDIVRQESDIKNIEGMFAEIKNQLADLKLLLAKHQISE
jgi:predicted  nucleic acid-binding Zn-ribbon protein